MPAPVGFAARAAWAMILVPSAEVRWKSREPAAPPEMGRIGGKESSSTHMKESPRWLDVEERAAGGSRGAGHMSRPPLTPQTCPVM